MQIKTGHYSEVSLFLLHCIEMQASELCFPCQDGNELFNKLDELLLLWKQSPASQILSFDIFQFS